MAGASTRQPAAADRVGWGTGLRGVVGSLAKPLGDELGLFTVGDLLSHFPRTYLEVDRPTSLDELALGELVTVAAEVVEAAVHPYQDKRTRRTAYRTEIRARLEGGEIWMTFFERNQKAAHWRVGKWHAGASVVASGKFTRNSYKRGRLELTHPRLDEKAFQDGGLLPVYPASSGAASDKIAEGVRLTLDVVADVPEPLPDPVRREHGLLDAATAYRWIHRPADRAQAGAAAKRLRFTEAFVTQAALAQRRHAQRRQPAVPRPGTSAGLLDAFDARMPFTLTGGQAAVEAEITADLAADHPMHRLLQGEVGSGKTVVALRAMLRVVDSGGQAALLAPTEVLAQQHHRSVTAMLGDLAEGGLLGGAEQGTRVGLLTGSVTGAARREALLQAASGEAGIVIGTHALLEEQVRFADLGLVVVDEQHRFGVEQRAALASKAERPPHVLVMTATPIPRTVAMTVFGDLDTSALVELPAGRSPIQTTVVALADHPTWFDRVWGRVREEVGRGRQVYVVCPRISADEAESDGSDASPDDGAADRPATAAVDAVLPGLADGPLAGLRLAGLHGRLTPDVKDATMRAFADGEVDVLVSTTVIEVGVDVPNATVMVVLDADRFGISQLHQLRGRVGRGAHAGLCLLVTHAAEGSPARERLDAVAGTVDGFRLAELDLQLRREGDVLGAHQSGRRRTLRLLSVLRDADVITAARDAAAPVVAADPGLDGHPDLRAAVAELEAEYLEKA